MQRRYKIGMIGLGSIGKRHLINIDKVLSSRDVEYSIDLIRRKNSRVLDKSLSELISNVYIEHEHIPDDYDVIFITNPTHLHYDTIKEFCHKTKNMFIEKPVFDNTSMNISDLSLDTKGIYYVACPLRYTEVIQYVKNKIDLNSVYSARVICSSYLPDWRPGLDYRETYSAHLDQGGGVSIDLIHEWDYMMYLFGMPKQVLSFRGKFSRLEIDSDDLSVYIAEYGDMLAEVHLDYFGRKAIREIQLFTADETIVVDIINSEIRFLNENKVIQFSEDRNSYQFKEIANFFDILEGKANNENDIYTALATLRIAKEGKL
jgi:predicted dehydrogenase